MEWEKMKGLIFKMIRVMFVCHGNISRFQMAEFIFKNMVEKKEMLDNFYYKKIK